MGNEGWEGKENSGRREDKEGRVSSRPGGSKDREGRGAERKNGYNG